MSTSFPVLIADIGGTFTRIALCETPHSAPRLISKVKTADYPTPYSALQHGLQDADSIKPKSALLAVAARISTGPVHMTNAAWVIDPEQIGRALALESVRIVNDFPPIAALLPQLDPLNEHDVVSLQAPNMSSPWRGDDGPMLVLGPGTGMGAALLRRIGDHYLIEPTEAGHIEFGASQDDELALWPYLERHEGRHTAESLLCGAGLLRLYRGRQQQTRQTIQYEDVAQLTQAALSGEKEAQQTLDLYASLLGRFAGDLALVFGATGGVFIAGGIAPRIIPLLQHGAFRRGFETKAPFAELMTTIPTYVMTRPDPALSGLALMARSPDNYWLPGLSWSRSTERTKEL